MMLFHKLFPSLVCLLIFYVMIWVGFIKLIFWHYPRMIVWRKRDSLRFVYHFAKSLDQAAATSCLGSRSDETISNRAGVIWLLYDFDSPWWVLVVKKYTDRWDKPDHIVDSIEPMRPEPKEFNY